MRNSGGAGNRTRRNDRVWWGKWLRNAHFLYRRSVQRVRPISAVPCSARFGLGIGWASTGRGRGARVRSARRVALTLPRPLPPRDELAVMRRVALREVPIDIATIAWVDEQERLEGVVW